MERTYINEVQKEIGSTVKVQGFIENLRNSKYMAFIVLKDITGKLQITVEKEDHPELVDTIDKLTPDSVITVTGKVMENDYVKMGGIEMIPESIEIESIADPLPILLSPGWLGMTGMTLLIGFVPLLWVSASYDDTRRSWWGMFGWATLAFVLWNALTIWWIWYATPVGPPAATLASTTMNMIAFMLFHTVSKKAPKALAYVTLVTAWITTEYWYTVGDFSWPWLILGNGFSHEVWAVQWYEYTGVFGGTLWVLLSNILI